ncbi:NAD(P)H-hydrate dehydratase [Bacteriovorax sp. PP10]|uniref:ADP-dependent (S)-NAD(P)H-hydrate dehydratase n=1 Tax=Bacteriovorax antarcticus TaxID=3088717 RepID=A0ABU5VX66_9BACT|nr:NAD(P)H-hydrate dehydratase [Bacteriovorax sp. PP10]MEA9357652.1 NAD(P)H-hydrate dehydratase [Bacteriovorax sp. PP10]
MIIKIDSKDAKNLIPKRSKLSSKIDGGKVLIVAGGAGLHGAGILSALAATRSGAGYTHLMTDLVKYPWVKFPDFILHKFSLTELKKNSKDVIAMGPGLGTAESKKKLLRFLIKSKIEKVVLDADALTMLSTMKVKQLPSTWILTPHEGELARLLGVTSTSVKKKRVEHLIMAQKKFGCVVLLKGAESLISDGKRIQKVSNGTVALAKAGTGDVLLGMIAAFYAQGLNQVEATVLGTFIHGQASADWMKKGNDHLSLRPMDLIEQIPKTIFKLRGNVVKV